MGVLQNIKIAADNDYYKTPILVDADTGKRVHFEAVQVPGKGWTVAKAIGSKKTGRTIERAEGFESIEDYTMHQAQQVAAALTRAVWSALAQTAEDDQDAQEAMGQNASG